jgi:hypothetical protein
MRLFYDFFATGVENALLHTLDVPMEVSLKDYGDYAIEKSPEEDELRRGLTISGRTVVDPSGMTVVIIPADDEGLSPSRIIECPEIYALGEGLQHLVAALGFALGTALSPGFSLDEKSPRFEPDSDEDLLLLRDLRGSPDTPFRVGGGIEVFDTPRIGASFVQALANRGFIRPYADVMRAGGSAAKFKELWRTLELAFQAHGPSLVELLVDFSPTQRLGFDRAELEALRAIRGRISHASSRAGLGEFSRANHDADKHLGRLWSLVDWVILSKRDASQSLEVDELQPLAAYIGRDGSAIVEADVDLSDGWWLDLRMLLNPRHR